MALKSVGLSEGSGVDALWDSITAESKDAQVIKIGVGAEGELTLLTVGAGAVDAGTPRFTLATDDPAVTLLGTIDTDTGNMVSSLATLAGAVDGTEVQVDVVNLPLPSGAATSASQSAIIGHVDGIESALATLTNTVDGTELQVDVVSLPLPPGAATAANQSSALADLATIIGHVDGVEASLSSLAGTVSANKLQADVISAALPTGAATSANQSTANSALSAIQTAVELLGSTVSGSEGQVDVVSSALPTGAATAAKQPAFGTAGSAASDVITVQGVASMTPLLVDATGFGNVPVSLPGGGSLSTVALTVDTSAHADGDVLAETQVVAACFRADDVGGYLQSVALVDPDDQREALSLLFFSANVSLGTENDPPSITDADALNYLGHVYIGSEDYEDVGGVAVARARFEPFLIHPASGTDDLYIAAISRGTGTYAGGSLTVRLGIEQS